MGIISKKEILKERSAGILLHITSLPGSAYVGDIGRPAKRFAEFLHKSGQSVWQLLPLQPVAAHQGFSPYSSASAFAGNPMLISIDALREEGLLKKQEVSNTTARSKAEFEKAHQYKEKMLTIAYQRWKQTSTTAQNGVFEEFCREEQGWLNDFTIYSSLKKAHRDAPWYKWPKEYKSRNPQALEHFAAQRADEIRRLKWIEMIFHKQWKELHQYCRSLNISLFGDMPFYVAHDSADVWCNPEIFSLDKEGTLTSVAGVPPDFFNEDGQLWGMPLYNWKKLEETGYRWWMERLKKNLSYFDLLRLDHFRAFASYWAVPAKERSAKAGTWKAGPGKAFFDQLKSELGNLPLVAEDLGEIDAAVYELRDAVNLPGMNVFQFAFADDWPQSPYLPHNHVPHSLVYTGTHDNDTTLGWFRSTEPAERKNISAYLRHKANSTNIVESFCRLAYMSVSKLAILPMQDLLGLGSEARMNKPATPDANWIWRLKEGQLDTKLEKKLIRWMHMYGRLIV